MKKLNLKSKAQMVNRALLWEVFIDYIETYYFPNAIEILDSSLISFEFENFTAYYLN